MAGPALHESRLTVATREGQAPLLLAYEAGRERFRGTVLVYPGFSAHKEVQRTEAAALARAGLLSVTVDAVGHGERRAPDLHPRQMLDLVRRSAAEAADLLDALGALLGRRTGRFGVTGISMGGYIAFAAATLDPRLAAVAPVLASPDWSDLPGADEAALAESPLRRGDALRGRPLLVLNAGKDQAVPPEASRAFVDRLRDGWPGVPGTLEYREYPESAHTMREQDWNDLWPRVVGWMTRHLAG